MVMVTSTLETILKRYLVVLLYLFSSILFAVESLPLACKNNCAAPFGDVIGQSKNTKAYSNCSDKCVSDRPYYQDKLYTGMKWQCVEYARRWLSDNKGITFGDVRYADEIWKLARATDLKMQTTVPWMHFTNQETKNKPWPGDLLIYDKSIAITGHVAVIVGVGKDYVLIAEQNYSNRQWEQPNYARKLPMKRGAKKHYEIVDQGVIGWMRVGKIK